MNKSSLFYAQHYGALDWIKRIRPRFLAIGTRAAHRITSPTVALTWRMSCTCHIPRKSTKLYLGLTVSINRPRTYMAGRYPSLAAIWRSCMASALGYLEKKKMLTPEQNNARISSKHVPGSSRNASGPIICGHKCEAVVKDKTADCKFFRWASDRQQTAEESFVGGSSIGVYNPNSKFDDRESLSVPKSPQTRIVDDESVGNDALLDELRSLRVKVALVEQRLRLGVVALYALVMALSVLCVLQR
ncbi:hypothetical protein LINGRAHAP2_LOCUS34452 [Linum grandiflorum]